MQPEDITLEQALDLIRARGGDDSPAGAEAPKAAGKAGKSKAGGGAKKAAEKKSPPVKKAGTSVSAAVVTAVPKAAAKTIVRKST